MPMEQRIQRFLLPASQGDSAAIESLLVEIGPRLEGMVRYRLGRASADWHCVEDLIQEVHAALIPSLSRFRGEGGAQFFAYLSGIVRHKVQDYFRRNGAWRGGRSLPPLGAQTSVSAGGGDLFQSLRASITSPSSRVGRSELFERVVGQVARLPKRQSEAVIMAFIDGLTSREIGEALGMNRAAAAMLVLRGVRNLKKQWGKQRESMN